MATYYDIIEIKLAKVKKGVSRLLKDSLENDTEYEGVINTLNLLNYVGRV